MSDQDIINEVLNGKTAQYRLLIERYHVGLINYCFNLLHNEAEAHDTAQDSFTKAYFKLKTYDETFSFSTWLYRIAYNTCIDHLRKRKKTVPFLEHTWVTSDTQLDYLEKQDTISQALQSLSDYEQHLLALCYWHDKSYEEISVIIDKPLGTIKTHLYRAKQKLKEALHENN